MGGIDRGSDERAASTAFDVAISDIRRPGGPTKG